MLSTSLCVSSSVLHAVGCCFCCVEHSPLHTLVASVTYEPLQWHLKGCLESSYLALPCMINVRAVDELHDSVSRQADLQAELQQLYQMPNSRAVEEQKAAIRQELQALQ